jgi:hypothetical protein
MSDFLKSNSQLDGAITNADNFEAMREKMLQTLASQGRVVRSRTDAYDVRVVPQLTPPPAPRAEDGLTIREDHRYERVIYPYQNSRIVITGMSENELDAAEEKIRAAFGSQR